MMDARALGVWQDIVRRTSRSLLQYVADSFPWVNSQEQDVVSRLQNVIAEERAAVAALVRLLYRHHAGMPYLGSYPTSFTTINYVSLHHLLPLLVDHQRRAMRDLERDLDRLVLVPKLEFGNEEARAQVEKLLAMSRGHLRTLEELVAADAKIAAT